MALRVLVAHPEPAALGALLAALTDAGHETFCAQDAAGALDLARRAAPDLVLWGLVPDDSGQTPGPTALAREHPGLLLAALVDAERDQGEHAPFSGCFDALPLPCPAATLRLALGRAEAFGRTQRELRLLRRERELDVGGGRPIVAASKAMIGLLEALERAASFGASVTLRGEVGTGKEGLARALHALSERRTGPFVAVRCHGMAPEALVAELFGRCEPGVPVLPGSLLEADGGTLFLDDVDALTAPCQRRLLGVLQSEEVAGSLEGKPRRVDVRVVAATARDLRANVSVGEFDEALFERLASVELAVPPLRERPEDIPLLVDHFTARASQSLARPRPIVADDALARLVAYPWPGNVRELENVIERAVLLTRNGRLTSRELPDRLEAGAEQSGADFGLRRARRRFEVEMIRRALRQTGGNRTHAAKLLEISHRALLYKLKDYGIKD